MGFFFSLFSGLADLQPVKIQLNNSASSASPPPNPSQTHTRAHIRTPVWNMDCDCCWWGLWVSPPTADFVSSPTFSFRLHFPFTDFSPPYLSELGPGRRRLSARIHPRAFCETFRSLIDWNAGILFWKCNKFKINPYTGMLFMQSTVEIFPTIIHSGGPLQLRYTIRGHVSFRF